MKCHVAIISLDPLILFIAAQCLNFSEITWAVELNIIFGFLGRFYLK